MSKKYLQFPSGEKEGVAHRVAFLSQREHKDGEANHSAFKLLTERGLLVALLIMVLVFTFSSNYFLTWDNFINILSQVAIVSLIAVPMTMVIVSGQIDLSVGSIVGLAGAVIGKLMVSMGMNLVLAVLITLAVGTAFGFINGFISAQFNIPAFIVTLATMTSISGVSLELTGGYPISGFPSSFSYWGQGFVGPIPVPVIFMAVIYLIGHFVMSQTTFGRQIYAIGGNEEAARLSGIKVAKIKIIVMTITGGVSALSGILLASKLTSGISNAGATYMLDVIAGVIIGGTNLFGGEGRISGTFLGILFMGILANGLVLIGISPFMNFIVQGLVVLFAVGLNTFKNRKRN
jgi:ribose transport system permease protein